MSKPLSTAPNPELYRRAQYWLSAHTLAQLPPDEDWEVAFAGRSNAGKSSAINTLTGQHNLARASKAPGRTRQIVFFRLDETRRLVDLPGYGYAKVPHRLKQHWDQVLVEYLRRRESLQGLVLLMDIRHSLMPHDLSLLNWCKEAEMPAHVLLAKADKLSRGQAGNTLLQVRKRLAEYGEGFTAQTFSALKKQGMEALIERLDEWLHVS